MAGLDGKITFMVDYRPCIVEITVKKCVKGLFHCWSNNSVILGKSGTFAIVELENGVVIQVEPYKVRFVDNLIQKYAFPEMEE